MKKAIIVLIVILIVLAIGSLIWYNSSISAKNKKNEDLIEVEIPMGTGKSEIADILKEKNVIKSKLAFKIYIKLNKISDFKAGKYYLKQSMSVKEICEALKTGIMFDPNQVDITYIEGKNIRSLAKTISEKTNNSEDDFYNKIEDKEYIDSLIDKYWFLTDEIKDDDIYYSLEGYLFPDTYTITNEDAPIEEIIEKMLDRTEDILDEYKEEIEDHNYSVHKILTIASIIEAESMSEDGRKDVSSVIYNRLKNGMAIQSDVTTYYAIQVDVWERDLYQSEINKGNPYNTRGPNMAGKLPIGPICAPSKSSIEAAIYPNDTDYLFFVADKNGKLYFTTTNEEHNEIINELKENGLWLEYE